MVGIGKQIIGANINLFGIYLVMLPLSYILALHSHLGYEGLWIGNFCGLLILSLTFSIYIRFFVNWTQLCS